MEEKRRMEGRTMNTVVLSALPCTARALEARLHTVCEHHGSWDAKIWPRNDGLLLVLSDERPARDFPAPCSLEVDLARLDLERRHLVRDAENVLSRHDDSMDSRARQRIEGLIGALGGT